MFVRIGHAAALLGVSPSCLRLWERRGRLAPDFRTLGGHRRYRLARVLALRAGAPGAAVPPPPGKTGGAPRPVALGYARVSAHKQKDDLARQVAAIQAHAEDQGWDLRRVYTDVGSGLNDNRRGLARLLAAVPGVQPAVVACTFRDRVARFGTGVVERYLEAFGARLECIRGPPAGGDPGGGGESEEGRLVKDLVALVTSFAGKLHRRRRGQVAPAPAAV